jgi:STE24 endopeptidase
MKARPILGRETGLGVIVTVTFFKNEYKIPRNCSAVTLITAHALKQVPLITNNPDWCRHTVILALAKANGVPADNVYQVDASEQSNRISANVSGLFGTASIRLNDNLLKRSSPREIEAVMGHEMGHYVLNHVPLALASIGATMLIGFALLQWVASRAVRRFGSQWQIRDLADPVGLPLLVALFSVFTFLTTPINNTIDRVVETQADVFGLEAARQPDGAAEIHLKLTEYRKANPGPVEEFFFYDHPAPRKRILMAMRWKAAHTK